MELVSIDVSVDRWTGSSFQNFPAATLRIRTIDGVSFTIQLVLEKKWVLKLQKSLQHNAPQFAYHTGKLTKIRRVMGETPILSITTDIQEVELRGEVWIDRLKPIIDQIIADFPR